MENARGRFTAKMYPAQADGVILQLAKGGYRAEAIAILEKQGARKLGEVTDENLAEVITLAEKALEG